MRHVIYTKTNEQGVPDQKESVTDKGTNSGADDKVVIKDIFTNQELMGGKPNTDARYTPVKDELQSKRDFYQRKRKDVSSSLSEMRNDIRATFSGNFSPVSNKRRKRNESIDTFNTPAKSSPFKDKFYKTSDMKYRKQRRFEDRDYKIKNWKTSRAFMFESYESTSVQLSTFQKQKPIQYKFRDDSKKSKEQNDQN